MIENDNQKFKDLIKETAQISEEKKSIITDNLDKIVNIIYQ